MEHGNVLQCCTAVPFRVVAARHREHLSTWDVASGTVSDLSLNKSDPKRNGLKLQTWIISISMGQEVRGSLAGRFCLGVCHKVALRISAGAAVSSEGSIRVDGPTSRMAPSRGQEASVPRHAGLSLGSCVSSWQGTPFPESDHVIQEGVGRKQHCLLCTSPGVFWLQTCPDATCPSHYTRA